MLRLKVATNVNMFFMLYHSPSRACRRATRIFDAIVPRAARLVCTRPEFAGLWESVMPAPAPPLPQGEGSDTRQRLRDEIDALVAHLYGLTRDDYAHVLASFPLVFPDTDAGHARLTAVLAAYDAAAG